MKRTKLSLNRETVRTLTRLDLSAALGGQAAQSDGLCATVQFTNCPTYQEITCASNLRSCATQPTYCS